MAVTRKLFCAILLILSISDKGMCATCSSSDIRVTQSITGNKVQGKPEFMVEVSNWCSCTQANVRLKCDGYRTVEKPDGAIFRPDGPNCLVNGGRPIGPQKVIRFRYAWDAATDFEPASATSKCA